MNAYLSPTSLPTGIPLHNTQHPILVSPYEQQTNDLSQTPPWKFSAESPVPIMISSMAAGALARVPMHGIDTIKAQLQALPHAHSIREAFTETFKANGIRGLYAGFGATVLGSAPASCLYFTTYELSKKYLLEHGGFDPDSNLLNLLAGLIAEAVSCVLWVPIDVIKERLQVQQMGQRVKLPFTTYTGPLNAAKDILATEGIRGIYRGYFATLLSFGPYSALYLMFYQSIKRNLDRHFDIDPASPSLPICFTAGGIAGGLSAFLTNPLDLVKVRLQIQRRAHTFNKTLTEATAATTTAVGAGAGATAATAGAAKISAGVDAAIPQRYQLSYHYRNTFDGLSQIFREAGFRGLMKGSVARIGFSAPSAAITISLFDTIKAKLIATPPKRQKLVE